MFPIYFKKLIKKVHKLYTYSCNINRSASEVATDMNEIGTVIVIQDITYELILKKPLVQTQKMEAVGQLSSGIAHDFNNALGGIIGATSLLTDAPLNSDSKEYVEMIKTSAERASTLTRQLLDFSRKGKLASTSISIDKIINDTVALLRNTIDKSIHIKKDFGAEKCVVVGDDSQIQNGIMNIAINASHAMPNGGEIVFRTSNVYLDENYCMLSSNDIKPGDYIQIEISDTGTGIEMENLNRIFEPFFTTKKQGKGTGLGLAAVYGMIESHSGTVTVYSELGAGTTFHLYIPLSDSVGVATKNKSLEKRWNGSGERILLVDDEDIMRIIGKTLLTKANYRVTLAESGEEAIALFTKSKFDIVLLDMIMPGINGKKTFQKLKEIDGSVKVILTSGFSKDGDIQDMYKCGLKGFIRKPFSQTELLKMIAEVL